MKENEFDILKRIISYSELKDIVSNYDDSSQREVEKIIRSFGWKPNQFAAQIAEERRIEIMMDELSCVHGDNNE